MGRDQQTLVFLHYFGGAARSWQWVIAQMADYQCIAIDLPGFGGAPPLEWPSLESYAQVVAQQLTEQGIADYTLVGHSMGGKIALEVAVTSDRPPQQVVLIAPSPPTEEPMPAAEKERLLMDHPSRESAETTIASATHQSLGEEQYALAIETQLIVDESAWRWWLLEGMKQSIAHSASHLSLPVTVLASQDDPVIPFQTIQTDVINLMPTAELMPIAGVGHLMPLEAPAWIATQLRQVMERQGMNRRVERSA